MAEHGRNLDQESAFLHDIEVPLNAVLFIVDRLTEELKEEEARLENDVEIERLFDHLAGYLAKIDQVVKNRRTEISSALDEKVPNKKGEFYWNSP